MTDSSDKTLTSELKEKLNEISLLLVMSSPHDDIGVTMLCELFDGLAASAAAEPSNARLVEGWKFLKAKRGAVEQDAFFNMLQELVSSGVVYCEKSGDVTFIHEKDSSLKSTDPLAGVDVSFLPEFLETHRMQLEDLESWLLDCEFKNEDGENVDSLVKRYIHSLKGDAGSLGLTGIAKACHFVEDTLAQSKVSQVVGQLMLFREWVMSYIEALSKGVTPSDSAEQFMERFRKACTLLSTDTPSGNAGAKAPNVSGEGVSREAASHEQVAAQSILSNTATSLKADNSAAATPTRPTSVQPAQESVYTLSGELDIFQEFVAEAQEHLTNVESIMLDAEGTYSKDAVDTIFRGIHSLKGGSAYFNFKEMTETSHLLENMLDEVRDGKRELDQTLTGLVLSYIDLQKSLLAAAKAALSKDGTIERCAAASTFLADLHCYAAGTKVGASKLEVAPLTSEPAAAVNTAGVPGVIDLAVEKPSKSLVAKTQEKAPPSAKGEAIEVKNYVKVDMLRLDHLIDSIGEMVIYSSMLIRRCQELLPEHEDVQAITHRVEKFTRDLQDVGMSMRLVPIKSLFQKMSRLVWDTSKKIGKEITFSMDGEDTELDRNLIDRLADPLMHMVRNALDHGVEPPEERQKIGKSRAGKVHLSASHSGGCVLIKIQDDGRGLNPEKLLAKAREKGIVGENQKLSEQEILQLIFAAGFSTAAVVTDISGRGVGMDVVRRNVESLRGRIQIDSVIGKGTTFTIEIPLTLAIVDGIEVAVGEEHFIVPSLSIVEFVKPTKETLNSALDQAETFHFRGKYLPIYRISELYEIEPRYDNPVEATFIVVDNNDELVALMVDEIVGELSTVIKSLGPLFGNVKGVSGCAVMPDGEVSLILDVRSIVQLARAEYRRTPTAKDETRDNA